MARLSGIPLACKRVLNLLVYTIVRLFFQSVQTIWWKINGTEKQMEAAALPENYESCVQVLKIICRNKFDLLQPSVPSEYLCVHERFESPKYIFDNDHVSLFMISKTQAVFSETEEKGMLLWRNKFRPFMYESQAFFTSKLLVVPIEHFHRMAEELGDPKGKLVFLFNTTRCGSTLLAQMFEETGKVAVISEPNQLNQLATVFKKRGDSKEIRQMMRDAVRWTCRPYPNIALQSYVVKVTSPAICCVSLLRDIFPDSVLLFMYRDVIKVSKSIFRMVQEYPTARIGYVLGKLSATLTERCVNSMGFYGPDYKTKLFDDLTLGIFCHLVAVKYYMDLRSRGFEVAAVRYEDIIADPLYASRQILKYCGLPENLAELCVNGMKTDSQRNSILSKANIGTHKEPELTPESKVFHNKILKKNGLPLIGEDSLLEGTITLKI